MDAKAFGAKVNRDIDKAKEHMATLGEDAATLGEGGVTGLSRKIEQLTDETKVMVTEAVKSLNQEVGDGLSTFNAKVQDVADRLPGDFGKKAARYPWVTITISLVLSLLMVSTFLLIKPGRQPHGLPPNIEEDNIGT